MDTVATSVWKASPAMVVYISATLLKSRCQPKNSIRLAEILGEIRVHSWILMVPRFESVALLAHAEHKAGEVRALNLPYVAETFRIIVDTDARFEIEKRTLMSNALATIELPTTPIGLAEVEEWATENDSLVQQLDTKLARIPHLGDSSTMRVRSKLLNHFIEGQNKLDHLRIHYLDIYDCIMRLKSAKATFLEAQTLLADQSPTATIDRVRTELLNDLTAEVRGLGNHTLLALSWEAIADWMLRCPLDFPEQRP